LVRSIETHIDDEGGIPSSYGSLTTAVGGDLPAGSGVARRYTPRQAGLANREAILPSGEPITSNGPENKFEFRCNTSPQRSFAQISGISPVRPPTHGAMRRAFLTLP